LQRMTESERVRRASECTVFARVSPEHKVQIVKAMQGAGRVVAMIGDGINDAAAIRLADVGIGVGADRSTAARSAADLVLPDADIRRVHHALLEGRALWHRVRDAVSILVGGNAGEVGFMVLGTALGGRAPISMRQMLLVNVLTDMAPALAVALAPSRDGSVAVAPVGVLLGRPLARMVAARGAATALGATLAWTAGRFTGRPRRASTMGLAALVTTQLAQTLLAGRHSRLVVGTSIGSFLALVALVQTPVVSRVVGCTPLGPVAWGIVLASAAAGTKLAMTTTRTAG
jgi:cation-transporting P-type ATPase I